MWDWLRPSLQFVYTKLIPMFLVILTVSGLWFFAHELERPMFDRLIRWTASPIADKSPVTLILIDDESLDRLSPLFGPPPWPRASYLQVFKKIQEKDPLVMVFDSHFTPLRGSQDKAFFQSLSQFPNLVSGLALGPYHFMKISDPQYLRLNLGVVNTEPDLEDGIVRGIQPFRSQSPAQGGSTARSNPIHGNGIFPSISLAAVFEYLNRTQHLGSIQPWHIRSFPAEGLNAPILQLLPESSPESALEVPLDDNGRLLLRWYTPKAMDAKNPDFFRRSHNAIPLWRFFTDNSIPKGYLHNKIALIGSSSAIFRDYHPTPISHHHLGADIHATAIDNLLRGEVLHPLPHWQQWSITLILFLLVAMLRIYTQQFSKTIFYMGSLMVIYLWLAVSLMKTELIVLDVVTPEVFMVVGLLAGSTWRTFYRDRQVESLEKAISQLVSSTVFDEIQKRGIVLSAGGQRVNITSMFVDIRDFTSIAERLPPNDVTLLLNSFYTEVEAVIFKYQGTIDKFMGDGILIMFGAPLTMEDHADKALAAARELVHIPEKIAQHWQERLPAFNMGISVNTGIAYVGFVGPSYKLEYTGVGDTVNICVRLQEHNKRFAKRLIVSEATRDALSNIPEDLSFIDEVSVRGRQSRIKIYTLNLSNQPQDLPSNAQES